MSSSPEEFEGSPEAGEGPISRRTLLAAGGAAVFGAGVLTGALVFGSGGAGPNIANGVVSCTNGAYVEGVWIDDTGSNSGFAKLTPPGGVSSTVTFSRPIRGTTYTLNKCGL